MKKPNLLNIIKFYMTPENFYIDNHEEFINTEKFLSTIDKKTYVRDRDPLSKKILDKYKKLSWEEYSIQMLKNESIYKTQPFLLKFQFISFITLSLLLLLINYYKINYSINIHSIFGLTERLPVVLIQKSLLQEFFLIGGGIFLIELACELILFRFKTFKHIAGFAFSYKFSISILLYLTMFYYFQNSIIDTFHRIISYLLLSVPSMVYVLKDWKQKSVKLKIFILLFFLPFSMNVLLGSLSIFDKKWLYPESILTIFFTFVFLFYVYKIKKN